MIVHITRFASVTAGALGGFAVTRLIDWSDQTGFPQYLVILIFIILGWSIGYVIGGIVGRELTTAFARVEERLSDLSLVDTILGSVGLLVGLLVALLLMQPLRLVQPQWLSVVGTVALFMMSAYAGVRIALVKRHDITEVFPRLDSSDVSRVGPNSSGTIKLLDTSAVIDGRFVTLRDVGLLEGSIKVPRFVLAELQTLSDSADDIKRAKGRRGLDLLTRLQSGSAPLDVFEIDYPDIPETDSKLMRLASDMGASLLTVDYNMSKVAEVQDISVININEVASALRPAFLPGEALRLRLVREGKEADQGVGYLEDGTMVVVQDGSAHVGTEVDTEVTSVLQTSAGRMIFARFISAAAKEPEE